MRLTQEISATLTQMIFPKPGTVPEAEDVEWSLGVALGSARLARFSGLAGLGGAARSAAMAGQYGSAGVVAPVETRDRTRSWGVIRRPIATLIPRGLEALA